MIFSIMNLLLAFFLFLTACHCSPIVYKNAGDKLKSLRSEMEVQDLDAFIIPTEDDHQSEYVSDYDKRRQWISGFTGSAGVAVVTKDKAALWTDGRYFIRAEQQLDKTLWILMREGDAGVTSIEQWLIEILKSGSKVGQNAKLTPISDWKARDKALKSSGIVLKDTKTDLVDVIWKDDRPAKPNTEIKIHNTTYSGKTWAEKVELVLARMNTTGADYFIVTALDEVAWLFNLRAADIPYNPMFFSYAIVSADKDHRLYIDQARLNDNLKAHLSGVIIRPYEAVFDEITELSQSSKSIWISPMSSFAIYDAVANMGKLLNDRPSPIRSIKAVKNSVEIEKARFCQVRDSANRVRHLYWLENQVKAGKEVTEVSSAKELESIQSKDALFRGLSFGSISAVGAHAADIHFSTSPDTNVKITKNEIYLLDAGAQFEDCTTDITRTHHFGKPTAKEIMAYTKVLQGSIDLAKLVFPPGYRGQQLDAMARAWLWKSGLDYNHGTGHGIGFYLNIHEFPPRTKITVNDPYDEAFAIGMFQSDEPGYYEEESKFGIRLETDIEVVKAETPFNFRNQVYLTFSAQTLVPFDKNLIDTRLLERDQVHWLNIYNERIRQHVGNHLKSNNETELYEYLLSKTEPFEYINVIAEDGVSSAIKAASTSSALILVISIAAYLL